MVFGQLENVGLCCLRGDSLESGELEVTQSGDLQPIPTTLFESLRLCRPTADPKPEAVLLRVSKITVGSG